MALNPTKTLARKNRNCRVLTGGAPGFECHEESEIDLRRLDGGGGDDRELARSHGTEPRWFLQNQMRSSCIVASIITGLLAGKGRDLQRERERGIWRLQWRGFG